MASPSGWTTWTRYWSDGTIEKYEKPVSGRVIFNPISVY